MKLIAALFALLFATSAQAAILRFSETKDFDTELTFDLGAAVELPVIDLHLNNFGLSANGGNITAFRSLTVYLGAVQIGYWETTSGIGVAGAGVSGLSPLDYPNNSPIDRIVFNYLGEAPAAGATVSIKVYSDPMLAVPLPASGLLLVGGFGLIGAIKRFRR